MHLVLVGSVAWLTYTVLGKTVRFSPYGPNEPAPLVYKVSRRTDRLLFFLPLTVRALVLKDLRSLSRSRSDLLERVVQMIGAAAFLVCVIYTSYHSNRKELVETGPVMVAMMLSLFGMRTITLQTCFDDRRLAYLLFRAVSPTTFLHWKWTLSCGMMVIRLLMVLGIVEVVTSLVLPVERHAFGQGLLVAVLSAAIFSLLGLHVTFRYLRRDRAWLSLSGWIVSTLTTSLVVGMGISYLLMLPMGRTFPFLQIIGLLPLLGVLFALYLLANKGVKRFVYEEP